METAGADLGMHSFDQYLYKAARVEAHLARRRLANATNRADLERRIMMETGGRSALSPAGARGRRASWWWAPTPTSRSRCHLHLDGPVTP